MFALLCIWYPIALQPHPNPPPPTNPNPNSYPYPNQPQPTPTPTPTPTLSPGLPLTRFLISFPLVWVGVWLGYRRELKDPPVKTNMVPRVIPSQARARLALGLPRVRLGLGLG